MKYLIAVSEALMQAASVCVSVVVIVFCVEYIISASATPVKSLQNFIDRKFNSKQAA